MFQLSSPIQMREIATIKDLEANAVDNFCILFAGAEFVIGHETEQHGNEILDAYKTQILSQSLRVEEVEETAEKRLVEANGFRNWTLRQMLMNEKFFLLKFRLKNNQTNLKLIQYALNVDLVIIPQHRLLFL